MIDGADAIRSWLPAGVELVLTDGLFRRTPAGKLEIGLRTTDGAREGVLETRHGETVSELEKRVRVFAARLLLPLDEAFDLEDTGRFSRVCSECGLESEVPLLYARRTADFTTGEVEHLPLCLGCWRAA